MGTGRSTAQADCSLHSRCSAACLAQLGRLSSEGMQVGVPPAASKRVTTLSGMDFEVDDKYELIKPIGFGAYGIVVSGKNNAVQPPAEVAIKKVTNVFTDEIECKRLLREMKLHRYLEHDNIVAIMEILQPTDPETFDDVYIVQELMDTDLHRIINSTQPLGNDHI